MTLYPQRDDSIETGWEHDPDELVEVVIRWQDSVGITFRVNYGQQHGDSGKSNEWQRETVFRMLKTLHAYLKAYEMGELPEDTPPPF